MPGGFAVSIIDFETEIMGCSGLATKVVGQEGFRLHSFVASLPLPPHTPRVRGWCCTVLGAQGLKQGHPNASPSLDICPLRSAIECCVWFNQRA